MSKKTEKSKNRLGLNLFEANLKRHPSVKGLFDEDGNKKVPKDSKNEFLILNIDNRSENESNDTTNYKEENDEKNKIKEIQKDSENYKEVNKIQKENISVKIDRVEEKLVDNKETFFFEMNDEDRKNIIKKDTDNTKVKSIFINSKPLNYEFNEEQKEFDKHITNAISEGKKYNEIEDKFINQLKRK